MKLKCIENGCRKLADVARKLQSDSLNVSFSLTTEYFHIDESLEIIFRCNFPFG